MTKFKFSRTASNLLLLVLAYEPALAFAQGSSPSPIQLIQVDSRRRISKSIRIPNVARLRIRTSVEYRYKPKAGEIK